MGDAVPFDIEGLRRKLGSALNGRRRAALVTQATIPAEIADVARTALDAAGVVRLVDAACLDDRGEANSAHASIEAAAATRVIRVRRDACCGVLRDRFRSSAAPPRQTARPAQVQRDREDQGARPRVHRVDDQRLMTAHVVGDEPYDEPDKCHARLQVLAFDRTLGTAIRIRVWS